LFTVCPQAAALLKEVDHVAMMIEEAGGQLLLDNVASLERWLNVNYM
jgi:hypothetical protein